MKQLKQHKTDLSRLHFTVDMLNIQMVVSCRRCTMQGSSVRFMNNTYACVALVQGAISRWLSCALAFVCDSTVEYVYITVSTVSHPIFSDHVSCAEQWLRS